MLHERIFFTELSDKVYIDTFVMETDGTSARDAVIIMPGGCYSATCMDREGERTALAYLARGVNAFVLQYITDPVSQIFPEHLCIAASAFAFVKSNAERFCINPKRIFMLGFSAGGHLCASYATKYSLAEKILGYAEGDLRPCGAILSYPVISAYQPTHTESIENLTRLPYASLSEDLRREHSIELQVKPDTPPAFIWHTAGDIGVTPHGSLKLAMAYLDAGVGVSLHLYPYGPHGMSLGEEHSSGGNPDYVQPQAARWLEESVNWMKSV